MPLEDLAGNVIPPSMEEDIYQSRLQIVLLSPIFLDFLYKNPTYVFGKLLHPDRVLAIMLGVKDAKIKPEHRAGTCFPVSRNEFLTSDFRSVID